MCSVESRVTAGRQPQDEFRAGWQTEIVALNFRRVMHSAPHLHDGRADTLEEAILHHGGEAAQSTIAYYSLEPVDRMKVIAFLKTLGVPE